MAAGTLQGCQQSGWPWQAGSRKMRLCRHWRESCSSVAGADTMFVCSYHQCVMSTMTPARGNCRERCYSAIVWTSLLY